MKDLSIGQSLMTLDEEGSLRETTFLGWLHRDTNLKTEFLKITTDNGYKITLTPGHIIMVNNGMKLASQVTVGDQLVTKTGPAVVVTIERIVTTGVYSPLTTTSTVLVSGILSSCFAASPHNNISPARVADYHSQAHTCFALVRSLPWLLDDCHSQDKVGFTLAFVQFQFLCFRMVFEDILFCCKGLSDYLQGDSVGKRRKKSLLMLSNY